MASNAIFVLFCWLAVVVGGTAGSYQQQPIAKEPPDRVNTAERVLAGHFDGPSDPTTAAASAFDPVAALAAALDTSPDRATSNSSNSNTNLTTILTIATNGNNHARTAARSHRAAAALVAMLDAVRVMQGSYFAVWHGTWPTGNDWTRAVVSTQLSAALGTLSDAAAGGWCWWEDKDKDKEGDEDRERVDGVDGADAYGRRNGIRDTLDAAVENTVNYYFAQVAAYYFGENARGLHEQAFDDMLWVVLGWLESIKFADVHGRHFQERRRRQKQSQNQPEEWLRLSSMVREQVQWHGAQWREPAAHRAHEFYALATTGWDTELCGGGMTWNRRLKPYKNAITNQLFVSAGVGMFLYYPGDGLAPGVLEDGGGSRVSNAEDDIGAGSVSVSDNSNGDTVGNAISSAFGNQTIKINPLPRFIPHRWPRRAHDESYLTMATTAYAWLNASSMRLPDSGLYGDGFHVRGWESPEQPGTRRCDQLSSMVFSYNQGVVLSGLRGLWLGTGDWRYLEDGHVLVGRVLAATGWRKDGEGGKGDTDGDTTTTRNYWPGLGRGGVLEEFCDSAARCSQDSQTFKGIFFHHLTEFCRPLNAPEREFVAERHPADFDLTEDPRPNLRLQNSTISTTLSSHLRRCATYLPWIRHNAAALAATRDPAGRYGMWWGRAYPDSGSPQPIPPQPSFVMREMLKGVDEVKVLVEGDGGSVYGDGPRMEKEMGQAKNEDERRWWMLIEEARSEAMKTILIGQVEQPGRLDAGDATIGTGMAPRPRLPDSNERGRGRTVETQAGAVAVFRALYTWEVSAELAGEEGGGEDANGDSGDGDVESW